MADDNEREEPAEERENDISQENNDKRTTGDEHSEEQAGESTEDVSEEREDTTAEEAGAATPPTGSSDQPLTKRLLAFNPEDWLVIVLVFLLVGVAVVSYVPLDKLISGSEPVKSSNPYCLQAVEAIEGNFTQRFGETTCSCLGPTNPDDPTLGERANNTYTIRCEYPNGQMQDFEIWVPNEEFQNQTNESFPQVRR